MYKCKYNSYSRRCHVPDGLLDCCFCGFSQRALQCQGSLNVFVRGSSFCFWLVESEMVYYKYLFNEKWNDKACFSRFFYPRSSHREFSQCGFVAHEGGDRVGWAEYVPALSGENRVV